MIEALVKAVAVLVVLAGARRALADADSLSEPVTRIWRTFVLVAVALGALYLVVLMTQRIPKAVEWDFLNYWLAGRLAAQDLPLYDAESYLAQALPFRPSPSFFAEVMFVGTMYPPPAVLLFLPAGHMDYYAAFSAWAMVNGGLLAIVVTLLWREVRAWGYSANGAAGWLAVAGVALLFKPVETNFYYAQVNLVIALLFMLVWRYRDRAFVGAFVGLGMCLKPYFGILMYWLLLRRRVGAMSAGAVAIAACFAVAALVLGVDNVSTYFTDNPVARAPAHLYIQEINQSALAVLRRAGGGLSWRGSALAYPPFMILAAALVLATGLSVLRERDERWAIACCISLGLLIAPQVLHHYSTVLLPVLLLLALATRPRWAAIGLVAALCGVATEQNAAFWLNLGVWTATVAHAWWPARATAAQPPDGVAGGKKV